MTGVCTAANTCTPYPTSQSVGTVHMRGVGSAFDLTSVQNTYQAPGSVTLAYPAFAAGDAIYIDARVDGINDGFLVYFTGAQSGAQLSSAYNPVAFTSP